jgi:hypothetical protein
VIVACAWCEAEGRVYVMAEREPFDDRRTTHTVCVEHRTELLGQLARMAPTSGSSRAALTTSSRE